MLEYTSDTRKIQELLDGDSGHVVLQNGVYDISRSLVIHDNTRLTLMPGAVLRLADGANTYLIVNDGYGKQADIGKKITKNVTIEGGVWDGNNVHQTRTSDEERDAYKEFHDECYYGMLTRFIGMEDFTLRDITIRNPEAYSMQISHVDRFTVEHIRFDYNMLRGTTAFFNGRQVLIDVSNPIILDMLRTNEYMKTNIKQAIAEATGERYGLGPYRPPEKKQEEQDPLEKLIEALPKSPDIIIE
ncbi:MAG: hypothetical protein ACI4N6_03910 [Eubacteriales bacterium]